MVVKVPSKNSRTSSPVEDADDGGEEVITSAVYKPIIISFRIVGTSPLLQNNPADFIGKTDDGAGLSTKKTYDDQEEAKRRCYKDEQGRFCHPSQSIIKAIIRAVTGKKFNKASAPALIRGNVFITEELTPLEDAAGKPLAAYTLSRMPVVMPNKARVLRVRPCWPAWQMRVALEINTALLSEDNIRESLMLAGPTVGIGDFRPEKGGRHGRFRV